MEISIKWNICRVCLQEEKKSYEKGEFVHLFDENKKFAIQIFELCGVSMKPDDSLPDKICNKCVTIVNSAVEFRKTCRSSNSYLQSILERTKSASTLFKPEISTYQINNDDNYNRDSRSLPSTLKDELERKLDEQNENVTVCIKKIKDDVETSHTLYSLEHQKDENELELNDNISDYTVELEEIIEMSDEGEAMADDGDDPSSMFENTTQNNKENLTLNKSGISQKLFANESFLKERNTEEEQYNSNRDNNDHGENGKTCNNSDEDFKESEDSVTEKYVEFISVDQEENSDSNTGEDVMVDEDEQLNSTEDQAQVSSTVDTKEEIEYYEDNTNLSSDSDKDHLINENISNCNISSTKAYEASNEPHSQSRQLQKHSTIQDSKSATVFSKRKIKRSIFKSADYEPVQVCVCEICGNRFTNQNKMKLHMKIHLQYKNHQCELCFKSFITACNLQAHMRIHTGEKPFECKYCGRRFNDRSSHIRHERTHTNEKPFECFNCGKSFTLATTLQNHMKVHSNERSYRCEPCGKSFKLPHHLKKHQSTTLHRSVLQIADDES